MKYTISQSSGPDKVPWAKLGDLDEVHFDPIVHKGRYCIARGVKLIGNVADDGTRPTLDCSDRHMWGEELLRAGYQRVFFTQAAGIITAPPAGMKITVDYRGPKGVAVRGLTIQGANNPIQMLDRTTGLMATVGEASGIYSFWSDGLEIDNCLIRGNGNGIFSVGSGRTYDIHIHDCEITGNGLKDSYRQHAAYLEALGVLFERNHAHDQLPGCNGMACKFRSGAVKVLDCDISDGGFLVAIEDPQESAGTQAGYIHLAPNFNDNLLSGNRFSQGPTGGTYGFHLGDDQGSRGSDPALRPHPERAPRYMKMLNNALDISKAKMTRMCLFDMRSNDQNCDVDGLTVTAKNAGLNWLFDYGNLNVSRYSGPTPNPSVRPLKGHINVT